MAQEGVNVSQAHLQRIFLTGETLRHALGNRCPELLPRQQASGGALGAVMQPIWGVGGANSGYSGSVQPPPPAASPSYDARAVDAWAMGVLMFLLTTGR